MTLPSRRGAADVRRADPFLRTHSSKLSEIIRQLEVLARHDHAVVLIEGEQGTGKTYLAQHLHNRSPRREGVFHRVDLGALDDTLCGSDLFGHVSGAFTGAQSRRLGHFIAAQGGTLFLDELAKSSKAVQQKLLHAIEYREVVQVGAERPMNIDVRIVAATNASIDERVAAGEFLPDLQSRFGHFRLRIPPLRERRADIVELAEHFVAFHAPRFGFDSTCPLLTDELSTALERADWPGNLRELDSAVQYLLVAAAGSSMIGLEHCIGALSALRTDARATDSPLTPQLVRDVVEATGSVSGAARKLGTARTTVYRYLRQPGSAIDVPYASRVSGADTMTNDDASASIADAVM